MSDNQMIATTGRRPSVDFTSDREPWLDDALCLQTDPEIFFPDYGQSANSAKKVCAACDVRERCLEFAMEREVRFTTNTGRHGVWGGLTPSQRAALAAETDPADQDSQVELQKLHGEGLMDTEIAERLGMSAAQVGRRRRRLGLRVNSAGGYRRAS